MTWQPEAYFHPVDPSLYDDPEMGPLLRQLERDDPDVVAAIAEVDRSLIQANLELTPAERLARNARGVAMVSEARRERP